MKKSILTFAVVCFSAFVSAYSKLPITLSDIEKGKFDSPIVGRVQLSEDGRYILYAQGKEPEKKRLVIKATDGSFEKEIPDLPAGDIRFTPGSKAFSIKNKDTLTTYDFEGQKLREETGVSSYQFLMIGKVDYCSSYYGKEKKLILENLGSGEKKTYLQVIDHSFSGLGHPGSESLIYTEEADGIKKLHWINLGSQGDKVVAETAGTFNGYQVSLDQKELAFFENVKEGDRETKSLLVCKQGESAPRRFDNNTPGLPAKFSIGSIHTMTFDGRIIVLMLSSKPQPPVKKNDKLPNVDLWSYKDNDLPKNPSSLLGGGVAWHLYYASLNLDTGKIKWLNPDGQNDYIQICKTTNDGWGLQPQTDRFATATGPFWRNDVVDFVSGKRFTMTSWRPQITPDGKGLLCYDMDRDFYFYYDVKTRARRNLTDPRYLSFVDPTSISFRPYARQAFWCENGSKAVVYDKFDIWELDLSSTNRKPVCLTQGYGRAHKIVLRFQFFGGSSEGNDLDKDPFIVLGQNFLTKDQGVYSCDLAGKHPIKPLMSGRYSIAENFSAYCVGKAGNIVKAKNTNAYLVEKSTLAGGMNYEFTKDWKTAKKLTDFHPYTAVNWITSELHTWTAPDGQMRHGVLYKPENFDPKKKYPVIVTYYQMNSVGLHSSVSDDLGGDTQGLTSYYASNGYLVFVLDIYNKRNHAGVSAAECICQGGRYIAKKPWVDVAHIGIGGHSFGGFETFMTIGYSGKLFAAAISGAGISDLVKMYFSNVDIVVGGQFRMNVQPWERPDLYVENSAIFRAGKVQTPLLMMNNDQDGLVIPTHGVEMFLALRQLGKPVWMLDYNDGGHSVDGINAMDVSIRSVQFFDHYLKGKPAPKWMTEGISPRLKQVETGLNLDTSGKRP